MRNSLLIELDEFNFFEHYQIIEVGQKTALPPYKKQAYQDYLSEHIPQAHYVDLSEQFCNTHSSFSYQKPGALGFKRSFEELGLVWDHSIIIYDRGSNIWASRLCWLLRAFGHLHSYVLNGGFKLWKQQKLPLQSGLIQSKASQLDLNPKIKSQHFTDLKTVLETSQKNYPAQLLNVLRPEVFSGKEKVYGRRGHIPQSINLPFQYFLDQDNRIVHSKVTDVLDLNQEILVYCGSGITASGAAIALQESGAKKVKIYDGSMTEWSLYSDLPLICTL